MPKFEIETREVVIRRYAVEAVNDDDAVLIWTNDGGEQIGGDESDGEDVADDGVLLIPEAA